MWNYPIDDPENGIQGDFILSPFSIRQNIGLNRGTDYKIVVSCDRVTQPFVKLIVTLNQGIAV